MPDQSAERQRLAAAMDARRIELGLTWQQVADAGGISVRALHSIRSGDAEIRPLTGHGIEKGLHWEQGSLAAVLDGREPEEQGAKVIPLPVAVARVATGRLGAIEEALGSPIDRRDGNVELLIADQPAKDPAVIAREIAAIRAVHASSSGSRGASGGRLAALPFMRLE